MDSANSMSRLESSDSFVDAGYEDGSFSLPPFHKLEIHGGDVEDMLFDFLKDENDLVSVSKFWAAVKETGVRPTDPRLDQTKRGKFLCNQRLKARLSVFLNWLCIL